MRQNSVLRKACVSLTTLLASVSLAGCCHIWGTCPTLPPEQQITIKDVVQSSISQDGSNSSTWTPREYYAQIQTYGENIPITGSCSATFEEFLKQFAKQIAGINDKMLIVVTLDASVGGHLIADDLPLLYVETSTAKDTGKTCTIKGLAQTNNRNAISPFFRADPQDEIKIDFDIKYVDGVDSKLLQNTLGAITNIVSYAGAQAKTVGKLATQVLTPGTEKLDQAISSSTKLQLKNELSSTLKIQRQDDDKATDKVTLFLGKYLNQINKTPNSDSSVLVVELAYKTSTLTDSRPDGTINWPSKPNMLLYFSPMNPILASPKAHQTYDARLNAGSVQNFDSLYLRPTDGASISKQQMIKACNSLRADLNLIELTWRDELAVRYAALREKTDYFHNKTMWTDVCLSGKYTAASRQIPASGETEQLMQFNTAYTAPGLVPNIPVETIADYVRELYRIATQPGDSSFESNFIVNVDDPALIPPGVVEAGTSTFALSTNGMSAKNLMRKVAYGGRCAKVLSCHPSPPTIRELALFGKYNGVPDTNFLGYRVNNNVFFPLVAEWSAQGKLASIRVTDIETIKAEYSAGDWPVLSSDSCAGMATKLPGSPSPSGGVGPVAAPGTDGLRATPANKS